MLEPNAIREDRVAPWVAREVRLKCPHCESAVFVEIPWGCTAEVRQREIAKGINEHRVVCSGASAIEGRVYTIEYPRA